MTNRTPTSFDLAVQKAANYNDRPYGVHNTAPGAERNSFFTKTRFIGAALLAGLAVVGYKAAPSITHDLAGTPAQVSSFQHTPREESIITTNHQPLENRPSQ